MSSVFEACGVLSLTLFVLLVCLLVFSRGNKDRRSVQQSIIHWLYRLARFLLSFARGVDTGYTEFRLSIKQNRIEDELRHESIFGLEIKARPIHEKASHA